MKKLLTGQMSTGWSVQIYTPDRRLLCALDPSHGWLFALGLGLGFVLGGLVYSARTAPPPAAATTTPDTPPITAPLSVD